MQSRREFLPRLMLQRACGHWLMMTVITWACVIAEADAAIRYVDASATGANNGTTWADAHVGLQAALTASVAGDEIWVAAATYRPAGPNGSRSIAFGLKSGVAMYGGFPAGGSAFAQRDPVAHITTLSGDLNSNDAPNFANNGDNSYNVVRAIDIALTTVFDGFRVTGGNANGTGQEGYGGGGHFYDNDDSGAMIVSQCRFVANQGNFGGGGGYFRRGAVQVLDCRFEGNRIPGNDSGGGAYSAFGATLFQGCEFVGNSAGTRGGGLAIVSALADSLVVDCLFEGNTAGWRGGGLFYDFPFSSNLIFTLRECVFRDNDASSLGSDGGGGGLYAGASDFRIGNCEFTGNTAGYHGGGAFIVQNNQAVVANCTFRGNSTGSARGGGLNVRTAGARLMGCEFVGNAAVQSGGGVSLSTCCSTDAQIINCTIAYNTVAQTGGGLEIPSPNVPLINSILWGNSNSTGTSQAAQLHLQNGTVQCSYSIVQGWTGSLGGIGNVGSDPEFIDANGPDDIFGNDDDDLRLPSESPGVDSGDNAAIPADIADVDNDVNVIEPHPIDLDGMVRRFDDAGTTDTGNGSAPIVDRGAYELGLTSAVQTWIGRPGGDWFTPGNWSGSMVPDARTSVIIGGHAQIAQSGALANDITILDGGRLTISAVGALTAIAIIVESGGVLAVSSEDALLETGSINVLAGGSVQWTGGTIVIDGGGWTQGQGISIGCANAATLDVRGGASINVPLVQVCASGVLSGRGTIGGNVVNDGIVAPGDPSGILHIDGDYSQTEAAALNITLAGYALDTNYDTLVVDGLASLDGVLDVSLGARFHHVVGGTHTLLTSGSQIQTNFSSVTSPSLPDTAQFTYQQPPFSHTCSLFTMITNTGARLYVNANGPAGGNGQGWASSMRSLQSAIDVVASFPGVVEEIWVAQGTYVPDRSPNVDYLQGTFTLPRGVAMYGGFAGVETAIEQRDWAGNPTILSGDRFGDDEPSFVNRDDNLLTVVTIFGVLHDQSTLLDGFTVRGGNAAGIVELASGGGLKITVGRPAIRNCTFTENSAVAEGGAIYSNGGCVLDNCVFVNNRSGRSGGGVFAAAVAPVQVLNCTFDSNVASFGGPSTSARGGGLCIGTDQRSTVTGCTFTNNDSNSTDQGGGGAWSANTDFTDCTFEGNQTTDFGGAVFVRNDIATETVFANCAFMENGALDGGGGMAVWRGPVRLDECTFNGNLSGAGSAAYVWLQGTLRGESAFSSPQEVFNRGTVSPGNSGQAGVFEIDGVYRQANLSDLSEDAISSTLLVELGGTSPGEEHDVIDVTEGSLTFEGGLLQVELINSFVPAIGQQFTIVPTSSITGRFDVVTMPGLEQGLFASLTHAPEGVVVSVEELTSLIALGLDSVIPFDGTPMDVELADMDNDGDLDVVLLLGAVAPETDSLVIVENAGVDVGGEWLGFLPNPHTQAIVGDVRSMALGRLNGDAYADVLVTNYSTNAVNVFLNAANGTTALVPGASVPVAGGPYSIAAAKDDTFAVDFAVGSETDQTVRHMRNNGAGNFTLGGAFVHAREPDVVELADLDGDLESDLVVVRRDAEHLDIRSTVEVRLYNTTTQSFGSAGESLVGFGTSGCAVIDLNGDASPDIVTADTNSGRIAILLQGSTRSTSFLDPIFIPVGVEPRSLIARDLDDDGDADLALLASSGDDERRLRIIRNDLTEGQLILAAAIDVVAGDNPLLIVADDVDQQSGVDVLALNGDGLPLAQGGGGASLSVLLAQLAGQPCLADTNNDNTVNVTDLLAVISAWGACTSPPCAADINGDGQINVTDLLAVISAWGACP